MLIGIAFDANDLIYFNNSNPGIKIIYKRNELSEACGDNVILPEDFSCDDTTVLESIRSKVQDGIVKKEFANNFFECSVLILLQYMKAIDKAAELYPDATFIYRANAIRSQGVSYYLSEYESANRFLYKRSASIGKYVVQYASQYQTVSTAVSLNLPFFSNSIRYFARDALVALYRVTQRFRYELKIGGSWRTGNEFIQSYDIVFIVRTAGQINKLRDILVTSHDASRFLVLYSPSIIDANSVTELLDELKRVHGFTLEYLSGFSLIRDILAYLRILIFRSGQSKTPLTINNVKVDLDVAVREMSILSVDYENYRNQLSSILSRLPSTSRSVLCDFELTSPYAAIDASCGKQSKMATIHIMACDRGSRNVPFNVYGDFLIVDLFERLKWYKSSWSNSKEKLLHLGNIRLSSSSDNLIEKTQAAKDCVYFFSPADVSDTTSKVVETVMHFCLKKQFSLKIKLHPRDSGEWVKKLNRKAGLIVHGVRDQVPFGEILFAFCPRSAIIYDLISSKVPFICFTDIVAVLENEIPMYQAYDYPGFVRKITPFEPIHNLIASNPEYISKLHASVFGGDINIFDADRLSDLARYGN